MKVLCMVALLAGCASQPHEEMMPVEACIQRVEQIKGAGRELLDDLQRVLKQRDAAIEAAATCNASRTT